MNLNKAIEILDLNIKEASSKMPPDVKTALELGVEALKRELWHRRILNSPCAGVLPGETNDNGGH